MHHDKIAILDFGSQTTQLIARRIREIGVYCEIFPHFISSQKITEFGPKAMVFSGGPASVNDTNAPQIDPKILEMDTPILGICYGMQLLTHHFGGKVEAANHREYGKAMIIVQNQTKLFEELPKEQSVWMSHGDLIVAPPEGFVVDATSTFCPVASMSDVSRRLYGVQFHPEVRNS